MKEPLILSAEEYEEKKAQFIEYSEAFSDPCVPSIDARAWTAKTRAMLLDGLSLLDKKGIPSDKTPIWGPTVKSDSAITLYFRFVDQGTEEQYERTDGESAKKLPPPLPEQLMGSGPHGSTIPGMDGQGSGGGGPYSVRHDTGPDLSGYNKQLYPEDLSPKVFSHTRLASEPLAYIMTQKLYRVVEAVEVTAEDVSAEMSQKKRKNAKPAIYIRGSIVEPKMRIEI